MFSRFWDIIIVASDHLQSTFWVQVQGLYLRRCWRWIRKPDSQNDSSQKGASTPDSTFSWTAGERKAENMSSITTLGKPGRNCIPWKNTDSTRLNMFLLLLTEQNQWGTLLIFLSIFFAIRSLFYIPPGRSLTLNSPQGTSCLKVQFYYFNLQI